MRTEQLQRIVTDWPKQSGINSAVLGRCGPDAQLNGMARLLTLRRNCRHHPTPDTACPHGSAIIVPLHGLVISRFRAMTGGLASSDEEAKAARRLNLTCLWLPRLTQV